MNDWFQIKDPEDLSIGDMYFYWYKGENIIHLAEFDGEGFCSDTETVDLYHGPNLNNMWFMFMEYPNPPKIKDN